MKELLRSIRENSILLKLVDGDLQVFANHTGVDATLIGQIREEKQALIKYLTDHELQEDAGEGANIIPVSPPQSSYVLSSSQRRVWLMSQMDITNVSYNIPGAYEFKGDLNQVALHSAFDLLIARHEILRTVFKEDRHGEPRQFILSREELNFRYTYIDLRNKENREDVLRACIHNDFGAPFILSEGPLFRASLYHVEPGRYVLSYVIHHIISDGWSIGLLMQELLQRYEAFNAGDYWQPAPLRIQYKDYAVWQQDLLQRNIVSKHKSYWLRQFGEALQTLDLPGAKVRPARKTYNGEMLAATVNKGSLDKFKEMSQEQGATLFMALTAILNTLLYRCTGIRDIVLGSPFAGRDHRDLEDQLGLYLNILALRTRFDGADSFVALLRNVREVILGAFEHQAFPLDELVDLLNLHTDASRSPLFDIMIILQNRELIPERTNNDTAGMHVFQYATGSAISSKYDATFYFTEGPGGLDLVIEYNKDIYQRKLMDQMAAHFVRLIDIVVLFPEVPISRLDYLTPDEKHQLLEEFNFRATTTIHDSNIVRLFEQQVVSHPDAIAVESGDCCLTYGLLNERANKIAHYLRRRHAATTDDRIGLLLGRNVHMPTAILGVLKAGSAYLPIDPGFPAQRIELMLKDSECKVVLDEATMEELEDADLPVSNPDLEIAAGDLAYVIYTSGSTGIPKGVMISHANVVSFFGNMNSIFGLQEGWAFAATTNYTFDISVLELLGTLCYGLKVVMTDNDDPGAVWELMNRCGVQALQVTPSRLSQLLEYDPHGLAKLSTLRVLLVGGEALGAAAYQRLKEYKELRIFNVYGPTETTIWSTMLPIVESSTLSIGTPLKGERVIIADPLLNLVPIGVAGEICIGGGGVARGYWRRPELSAEKFILDPFHDGQRLYRTGDMGRWTPEGAIEFIGRKDAQVKVRGFRIELGEIEHALESHPDIYAAAVILREYENGDRSLDAFFTGKESVTIAGIRTYLGQSVPAYMIPEHFTRLAAMPLNASGKIDRARLAAIEKHEDTQREYTPPGTPTEEKLVSIWQEVLGGEKISVKDNFFDLGGQSLKATRLSGRIYKTFSVVVTLKELFEHPVLEDQARLIDMAPAGSFLSIPQAPRMPDYPLSSMQRLLWILGQLDTGNTAYNLTSAFEIEGVLDIDVLQQAFSTLIARHDSLRTVFRENIEGQVRQVILDPATFTVAIEYADLRNEYERSTKAGRLIENYFNRPFDLREGPLLRIIACHTEEKKWILGFVIHHIICDGWSMAILSGELLSLYASPAAELPALKIQYKDFAAWQQLQLAGEAGSLGRAYWLEQMKGTLPDVTLPLDRPRPVQRSYRGANIKRLFKNVSTHYLQPAAKDPGATLFMQLLSVVSILVYRYSGQTDMIIGTPVAGRGHVDLENQIGFFANTLALRMHLEEEDTFAEVLAVAKEVVLGAQEHQLYPFETLVEDLGIQRDISRNPLFDVQVMVETVDESQERQSLAGASLSVFEGAENTKSVFDLVFNFLAGPSGLELNITFNTDIFDSRTIGRMGDHIDVLLHSIAVDPENTISRLKLLADEEQEELIAALDQVGVDYPREETLVTLFESQVKAVRDNIAVVCGEGSLTYRQLDQMANRLASCLRVEHGIKADSLIGVLLDRSEHMIMVLLAILKAGGAYIPIDPDYPQERIDFILADSGCTVLIDNAWLAAWTYRQNEYSCEDLSPVNKPDDLAYVIYTSGTTGVPKGALIEHRNVVRLLRTDKALFDFSSSDVWSFFHSYCFDFSVWEMYGALLFGGRLVIVPKEVARDPAAFAAMVGEQGISVMNQTPSAFYNFIRQDMETPVPHPALRFVIFGGEALHPARLVQWNKIHPGVQLINMYGITETTVHVTYKKMGVQDLLDDSRSIGRPIPTLSCYVLDQHLNLLPKGVVGELYVGGDGLARGYLKREELTAQRFIPNPFRPGRLYRSGDKARVLDNGELEYIGRIDHQVKIRGYRIEIGEIESALKKDGHIEDAVVVCHSDDKGDNYLVAYLIGERALNIAAIRAGLATHLPAYMLPAGYVQLNSFPLTSNGKLDLQSLPDPQIYGMSTGVDHVGPRNELEAKMVAIWQDVLKKDRVGIRDNFFELGGDSIRILKVVAQFKKQLGLYLQIADVYTWNNIEGLTAYISENKHLLDQQQLAWDEKLAQAEQEMVRRKEEMLLSTSLNAMLVEDAYPMSDIEKGMVYESIVDESLAIYHDQHVYQRRFRHFSIADLRLAMQLMVQKHPILRTSFHVGSAGTDMQVVHKIIPVDVPYTDLSDLEHTAQEALVREFLSTELSRRFVVDRAPLWRMNVFNYGNDEYGFVWQFHHAILDGWSNASLMTELNNVYLKLCSDRSFRPAFLKASYRDLILRHMVVIKEDAVRRFWMDELNGYTRLDLFSNDALFENYSYTLNGEYLERIKQTALSLSTTVKALSMAAFVYLMRILGRQEKVVAGYVTNIRPNCEDGEKILGCFLNTIPFVLEVDDEENGAGLTNRIQQKLIQLKQFEGLSLLEIAQTVQERRQYGNPFFDVLFNYVDFHIYNDADSDKPEPSQETRTPSPSPAIAMVRERVNTHLNFTIGVTGGVFDISVSIGRSLRLGLEPSRIIPLYCRILDQLLAESGRPLRTVSLTDQKDQIQQLTIWNPPIEVDPVPQTLHSWLDQRNAMFSSRTAVESGEAALSYADLKRRSSQLANLLRQQYDIRPDDLVGIQLPRNEQAIIAILGILRSGGAFLPMDAAWPAERIGFITADSRCKLVIDEAWMERFDALSKTIPSDDVTDVNKGSDLAYVIYTSGSTGRPKGVMVEHAGIINTISAQQYLFGLHHDFRILQFASLAFDAAIWEIGMALSCGGTLSMVSEAIKADPVAFGAYLKEKDIDIVTLPPVYLRSLDPADLMDLKTVITAGEAADARDALALSVHGAYFNAYGPTETSICATVYRVDRHGEEALLKVPIGRAIANTHIYILDQFHRLQPAGMAGEIYISGAGVARGYLHQPDLTAEKFGPNPFAKGLRMYRTGDEGRWLPNGQLEFLGRLDDQIKLRGFRIEPGEIEQVLLTIPGVNAAAVLAVAVQGENELTAYLAGPSSIDISAVQAHLRTILPHYMVPTHYLQMDSLPVNTSGKIDKKALAGIKASAPDKTTEYRGPANEVEEKLVAIWEELLGRGGIGVRDSFFDLGGHSIMVMRLMSRIHREFNVRPGMGQLFGQPTIENLAKLITREQWFLSTQQEYEGLTSENQLII